MDISIQIKKHNAKIEVENDLRKSFYEGRKFFWWKCPLKERALEVLIAASKSVVNGACKGGLVNERGRPDGNLNKHVFALCNNGYLGEYGTFREFEPTLLGWATLDAFARDRACFPDKVQRSLREFYEGTPSCPSQDPPTSTSPNGDLLDAVVPIYLPTIR